MVTVWQTLGITPTRDEREIRRAYARQLKHCRPETHPESYQRLREAFEEAKREAKLAENEPDIHYAQDEDDGIKLPSDIPNSFVRRTNDASRVNTDELIRRGESSGEGNNTWRLDGETSHQAPFETQALNKQRHTTLSNTDIVNTVENIAMTLAFNTYEGMNKLTTFLELILLRGSLSQQQLFHQQLSWNLANMQGLTEEGLIQISALMGWRLKEDYASPVIPLLHQKKLEEQLSRLERASLLDDEWRRLEQAEHHGGFINRHALLALKGKDSRVPFWYRMVPGLVQSMNACQCRLSTTYPELLERLNPAVLQWLNLNPIAISCQDALLFFFWGMLISLAVFVTGSPLPVGVGFGVLALTYLFIRRLILRVISVRPLWSSGYYLVEFLFSLCLIISFILGLFNSVVAWLPDDDGGALSFALGIFLLAMIHGWHEAAKNKPWSQRPGFMVALLFTGPGDLLWRRNCICLNRFLFILYCLFGLAIAIVLFHFLTQIFF
jgi:hypothetical protein